MTEAASRFGMTLVRVGAVVLALGAGAFLVHRAHTDANPDEAQPVEEAPAKPAQDNEFFLRSSKSISIDGPIVKDGEIVELKPEATKDPVFMPSTKSGIRIDPRKSRGQKQQQKKKKKPAFFPSSKSMPPPQTNDG